MDHLKFHTDKLRASGLRPTKQRLAISKILFNRKETFHFTIDQLKKIVEKNTKKKISVGTLYNTVHAFEKKGYIKEISLKGNKTFFDTNTNNHHHFFDEDTNELIDCDEQVIQTPLIKKNITGKKINSVEVLVKVATDNQNQK